MEQLLYKIAPLSNSYFALNDIAVVLIVVVVLYAVDVGKEAFCR